jgi:scyllo-inositol 2-dehydrogenase (NADP+)
MNKNINTGIIGFGLSGRYFFAPFLATNPLFQLTAVVTSQKDEAEKSYPGIITYNTPEDIFNDKNVELVAICTPNFTHFELAKKALSAGKHVIVEKPFTINTSEADHLISLASEQNKKIIPFQNRRFDGDFLTVKHIIEKGLIGEVLEFDSRFDRFRPDYERVEWKNQPNPGTGLLYDIGPHLIDQALSLFGKPNYVFGDIRRHRPTGANDDYFEIQLHYNTLKVILKAGVMTREIGHRYAIHGRKGSFIKYGLDVQEPNLKNGMLPGNPLLGKDHSANYGLLHAEINGKIVREKYPTSDGNYMAFFDNVAKSILYDEPLLLNGHDGKAIIEIIEAAITGSEEKRAIYLQQ